MHDDTLTQDNREKLMHIADSFNQCVEFYNVGELCAEEIAALKINKRLSKALQERFTVGMFYRFFVFKVVAPEIEKIIYLDSDIIVNLDIEELWQIDIDDKILGVITIASQKRKKVLDKNYFNSGVLIMNRKLFQDAEETLKQGIDFIAESPDYEFADQEILNYCFANQTLHLPPKYNTLVKFERRKKVTQIDKKIYHFNGPNSTDSLGLDMSDSFNRLWMEYFAKTPWFEPTKIIGRLHQEFSKIYNNLLDSSLNLSVAILDKNRAFFVEPSNLEKTKEIFSIRDDEKIILAENEESIQKLIDAMKEAPGQTMFFVMMRIFLKKKFPFKKLVNEGFVAGKDFCKGWKLLSEAKGVPFNTHPIVKAM